MQLSLNQEVKDLVDLVVDEVGDLEEVIIKVLVEEVLVEIGKDLHLIKDPVLMIEVEILGREIVEMNEADSLEVMGV